MTENSFSTLKTKEDVNKLKLYLITQILRELETRQLNLADRNQAVIDLMLQYYQSLKINLPKETRDQVFHEIINEILGFGPLQPLLDDPEITEVMVNGKDAVFIERKGLLDQIDLHFESDEQILRIIDRIILPLGRRIDAENPTVDARLPDGSRVNAVIPPVAIDGPILTIRKFAKDNFSRAKITCRIFIVISFCASIKLALALITDPLCSTPP